MELYLMDKDFNRYAILDELISAVWHKKYYEAGDFEIYVPASQQNVDNLQIGNYVIRDDDDSIGIIEDIKIEFNETSEVDMLLVTGRFSESLYDRRIVWEQTNISSKSVSAILRTLIERNCVAPELPERKISTLALPATGTYEPFNQSQTINIQYTGNNLLSVIEETCKKYGLGFRHTFEGGKFYFHLYEGVNRSYSQMENSYVVFSDEYDNLLDSSFTKITSNMKNIALVAGEGEGTKRKKAVVSNTGENYSDLERREMFVDQRNLSGEQGAITETEYNEMLSQSGLDNLSKFTISEAFVGNARIDDRYVYKVDVNLGDICIIENTRWGLAVNSRVVGIIETQDESGYNIVFEFGS